MLTTMKSNLINPVSACRMLLAALFSIPAVGGAEEIGMEFNIDSPAIVERGDAQVTLIDVEAYLSGLSEDLRPVLVADSDRLGKALDTLLMQRQLRIGAQSESDGFWGKPEFQAELIQTIEKEVAELYLEQMWQREKLDDYSAQAEELYLTRPDLVRAPTRYDFSHILIRHGNRRSELAAMRKIIAIYDELSEGADFAQLAETHSEDNSEVQSGGQYSDIESSILDGPVRAVLRSLKGGQISQPFRSNAGWHIVRLDARETPEYESFKAARDTAMRIAEQRHKQSFHERALRRMTSQSFTIDDAVLNDVLNQYTVGGESAADAKSRIGESIENAR